MYKIRQTQIFLFTAIMLASCVSRAEKTSREEDITTAEVEVEQGYLSDDTRADLEGLLRDEPRRKRREEYEDARRQFSTSEYYAEILAERQAAKDEGAYESELAKQAPWNPDHIPPDFSFIPSDGQCVFCDVYFDITPAGLAVNIFPICSEPKFNDMAFAAMTQARFLSRVRQGKTVPIMNVIYPIEKGRCE
tara:strand:- start:214 stop:789 length:576 start_codon:yes stop_codon:yes gene_type:complete